MTSVPSRLGGSPGPRVAPAQLPAGPGSPRRRSHAAAAGTAWTGPPRARQPEPHVDDALRPRRRVPLDEGRQPGAAPGGARHGGPSTAATAPTRPLVDAGRWKAASLFPQLRSARERWREPGRDAVCPRPHPPRAPLCPHVPVSPRCPTTGAPVSPCPCARDPRQRPCVLSLPPTPTAGARVDAPRVRSRRLHLPARSLCAASKTVSGLFWSHIHLVRMAEGRLQAAPSVSPSPAEPTSVLPPAPCDLGCDFGVRPVWPLRIIAEVCPLTFPASCLDAPQPHWGCEEGSLVKKSEPS